MIDFKNLPVYKSKQLILDSLQKNKVIIVESPTGSGKTTQIPLILHEAGYDSTGVIGITQPRRIATLNVSSFIKRQIAGQGLSENFCGYKMRFYDTTDEDTRIKILTDGMLLQELKADSMLSRYSVVMVDEAHERSLNIDFILGLLKKIIAERSDLKVIISSATINTEVFSRFFDNAPVITIDARIYDVDIRYCPIEDWGSRAGYDQDAGYVGRGRGTRTGRDAAPGSPEGNERDDFSNPDSARGGSERTTGRLSRPLTQSSRSVKARVGSGRFSRTGDSFSSRSRGILDAIPEKICEIINDLLEDFRRSDFKDGRDTLVFLPGEADIKNTMTALYELSDWERLQIYPLYSRLNKEEQERVFDETEPGKIKVVLATNIAETSLTINGIKAVIDSGLAKINYYNQFNFTSSLVTRPVSRSSAMQRAGRAGRTAPGVCYRLYTEDDFRAREMYTPEEILRTDLSEVVLRMVDLGIKDFENFDFITRPASRSLESGENTLRLIGAVSDKRELTRTGETMVKFPLLPRHSRCIANAIQEDIDFIRPVAICVSFLSCKSPYVLPPGMETEARAAHKRWVSEFGDFVGCQFLYKKYTQLQTAKEREAFCDRNFLDLQSMDEIHHVAEQLCDICREMGIPVIDIEPSDTEDFARKLLTHMISGLVQYVCVKKKGSVYSTPYTGEIFIHPASAYFRDSPAYIVAGEIVMTSRMYARTVSPLKFSWIEATQPRLAAALRKIVKKRGERDGKNSEGHGEEKDSFTRAPEGRSGKGKKGKNKDSDGKAGFAAAPGPGRKSSAVNFSDSVQGEESIRESGEIRGLETDTKKTYSLYGIELPVVKEGGKKDRAIAIIDAKIAHHLYTTYKEARRHPKSINAAILYRGRFLNWGDRLYEVLSVGRNYNFSEDLIRDVPEKPFFPSNSEDLSALKKHLNKIMLLAPLKRFPERLGFISLNYTSKGFIFRVEKGFNEAINNSAYALLSLSDMSDDSAFSEAYNRVIKYLD